MKKLDHPNIVFQKLILKQVKLHEVIDDYENQIYLIMDYVERGALLSK